MRESERKKRGKSLNKDKERKFRLWFHLLRDAEIIPDRAAVSRASLSDTVSCAPLRTDSKRADVKRRTCLANHNFQERDCQTEIKALFTCCREMYERGETSTACSKLSVVESRLEQWRIEEAAAATRACDERKQRTEQLDM